MWILALVLAQTRPYRVLDDVARMPTQRLLITNAMVVKAPLPQAACHVQQLVYSSRGPAFEYLHATRHVVATQLEKPMDVVGHDHPREGTRAAFLLRTT